MSDIINDADRRLTDAAPDLLAACEAALAHICGDGWDGTFGEHEDNPVPRQLREAIAKAKGEGRATMSETIEFEAVAELITRYVMLDDGSSSNVSCWSQVGIPGTEDVVAGQKYRVTLELVGLEPCDE